MATSPNGGNVPLSLIHMSPRSEPSFGVEITEFEMECEKLGLPTSDEKAMVHSVALRYWAIRNASRRYVPTSLLNTWGINVEAKWTD